MAVYATIADAELIYGTAYITVACDRDLDGNIETDSFNRHLIIASQQIDGYLLGRYPLPLAIVPEIFGKYCVDIAVYNACPTQDVRTNEMRERYEDAIRYMRGIAENKIKLQIAPNITETNISAAPQHTTRTTVEFDSCARQFTSKKMRMW